MRRFRRSLLLASIVAGAGCGGEDGGPVVPPPGDAAFEAAGGSGQSAIAGTTLPVPYTVRLSDDGGQPVAGATIRWSLDAGTGSLSASSSVTDAAGHASVLHTLGPLASPQAVSAALSGSTVSPVVFRTTAMAAGPAVRVAEIPVPPDYGIHDTFVREGLAFVCAWNTGVIIYDVGNGVMGGSPSAPVEVSRLQPPIGAVSGMMGAIHNAWWFHNPVLNEKRYLFLGQEGPGVIGSSSRGDIFVVDVSDLRHPVAVASFGRVGEGTHNFWMDEPAQVLYAAYYNGGVVAIDVSGTLSGDLSGRQIGQVRPGGTDSTYIWGVQVANGFVYASDMETGLWQLSKAAAGLEVLGGGRNVLERWTSDLWVSGNYAFTGTWGGVARRDSLGQLHSGDALKVWTLMPPGEPLLTDSLILEGVGTVSDVEVTADGQRMLLTTERGGSTDGFVIYTLASPGHPAPLTFAAEAGGLHTGTFSSIGGRDFVFAARNPSSPARVVYDVTGALH
jgi:hypothetical protein